MCSFWRHPVGCLLPSPISLPVNLVGNGNNENEDGDEKNEKGEEEDRKKEKKEEADVDWVKGADFDQWSLRSWTRTRIMKRTRKEEMNENKEKYEDKEK